MLFEAETSYSEELLGEFFKKYNWLTNRRWLAISTVVLMWIVGMYFVEGPFEQIGLLVTVAVLELFVLYHACFKWKAMGSRNYRLDFNAGLPLTRIIRFSETQIDVNYAQGNATYHWGQCSGHFLTKNLAVLLFGTHYVIVDMRHVISGSPEDFKAMIVARTRLIGTRKQTIKSVKRK